MCNKLKFLVFTGLTFILVGCSSPDPKIKPVVAAAAVQEMDNDAVAEIGTGDPQVDAQLQTLMEAGGVPSMAVGIVVDDTLTWAKGYNSVAGVDTVYIVGSVTKPFIATAALQLYERGLLDLDADINTYLPYSIRHPQYPEVPITVRMLLTHQSGLIMTTENFSKFENPDDFIYQYIKTHWGLDLPELNLDPHPSREVYYEAQLNSGRGILQQRSLGSGAGHLSLLKHRVQPAGLRHRMCGRPID